MVAPTVGAAPYVAKLDSFFQRYSKGRTLQECDGAQLNIEQATFSDRKNSFTAEGTLAVQSRKDRKQFAKRMAAYRDRDHPEGLDGVLAMDLQDSFLVLRSVAADEAEPIHTTRVRLSDLGNSAVFDLAVCKVLVPISVMRAP